MNEEQPKDNIPLWYWALSPFAQPCHGPAYHRAIARAKGEGLQRKAVLASMMAAIGGYW